MERWIELVEFPGYSISDHGRVRNDRSGRLFVLQRNRAGVVYVGLVKDGRQQKRSVAKLVADVFLQKTVDHYDTPTHIDADPSNNHYSNLTWRPRYFADAYHRQYNHWPRVGRPIRIVETGERFQDSWEACMKYVLLDIDIVKSITNGEVVRPIFKHFELAE